MASNDLPVNCSTAQLTYSLAVCLYFVIPREVTFKFYEPQPFMAENSTIYFSRQNPTNFTFEANLQLMGG